MGGLEWIGNKTHLNQMRDCRMRVAPDHLPVHGDRPRKVQIPHAAHLAIQTKGSAVLTTHTVISFFVIVRVLSEQITFTQPEKTRVVLRNNPCPQTYPLRLTKMVGTYEHSEPQTISDLSDGSRNPFPSKSQIDAVIRR